nr:reverse transcriptase domain-containing protein [Tanacetum cinerariifolium]
MNQSNTPFLWCGWRWVAAVVSGVEGGDGAAVDGSGGVGSASEGEWRGGSDRSGDEETFWFRLKNPAGKVFRRWRGGGWWPVGGGCRRDVPNDVIKLMMFSYSLKTFGEAWERFKEMLRACSHYGLTELTQIDTFYNGLNENDQDSLNGAAGRNLLSKTTREALHIIENKSKVRYSRNKPNVSKMNMTSKENASKTDDRIDKLVDQISTLVDIFLRKLSLPLRLKLLRNLGEMKSITNRSGVAYEGPSIPTPKKAVERKTEETTNKEQTNFQGSTAHIQPPVVPISELDVSKTLPKPNIPYPSRLNDQKLREKATNQMEKFFQIFQDLHFDITKIPLNENCSEMLLKKLSKKLGDPGKFLIPCDFPRMDVCHALADLGASINLMPLSIWKNLSLPELTPTRMTLKLADRSITRRSFLMIGHALIDVYGEEITLRVNDKAVTFNLNQTTRYSSTYADMSVNRIDVIDVAREEYAQEMLGFSNNSLGGNPTSTSEPIISQGEVAKVKSSIEEPPELKLKDLPSHLEYSYLEGVDKLPAIIAKDLKDDEKESLLKVLKANKWAIAWKITDIKGIDPFLYSQILMEEDYKHVVQIQRRVNLKFMR